MPETEPKIIFEKKERANTGCLRGILYFLIISAISLYLAVFGWNCINDVLALIKPDTTVTLTIPEDYTIPELSRTLAELGVIDQPWLFTFYCNFSHAEDTIIPNDEKNPTYTISSKLDYHAIVHSFIPTFERETVTVTIPEGKTLHETLLLISEAGVSDYDSLLAAVDESAFTYEFLDDNPMETERLEGYLYPNTYTFFTDSNPRSVLLKLLASFDSNLTPNMRKRLNDIDYTLHEVIIVASMIQMEAANASEMYDIASVIYNRLEKWDNPLLQIDATIQYILPERKEHLSQEDLQIDNPYNTRLYPGLPPGPICSPSIQAIRAALYPSNTKYTYYALGKDGIHHFFETQSGFNNFINSKDFVDN